LVRACRALAKIKAPRYVDSNTQPALEPHAAADARFSGKDSA
jgi:hypothetical protein